MKTQVSILSNFIFFLSLTMTAAYPAFAIEVESVKESCIDYAYSKGLKHYNESNWLEAYAYLKAAQVCFNHTNFKMSGEKELDIFWEELQTAMKFSYSQMQTKISGFSLDLQKPQLRDLSQMPK